jgi:hypothetical protein
MLVDVEKSLTNPSDNDVVLTYLDMIAVPDGDHHGKHGVPA